MRFHSLTRNSLCINPRHSPSLLLNKRKHAEVLFLVGQQGVGLEMKLAALNSHYRHQHHSYLRQTMWSGSQPCRRLGLHLDISLAGDTPNNHMRPVDQDGKMPMLWHGCTTRPTSRGYHHPSMNDSLLQTVGSWMASTLASEYLKSALVKFKIHLTLKCRIRDSGTYSNSNSSLTLMRC